MDLGPLLQKTKALTGSLCVAAGSCGPFAASRHCPEQNHLLSDSGVRDVEESPSPSSNRCSAVEEKNFTLQALHASAPVPRQLTQVASPLSRLVAACIQKFESSTPWDPSKLVDNKHTVDELRTHPKEEIADKPSPAA